MDRITNGSDNEWIGQWMDRIFNGSDNKLIRQGLNQWVRIMASGYGKQVHGTSFKNCIMNGRKEQMDQITNVSDNE